MQTAIECVSNGYTLRGMLHWPEGRSNVPLVIMFHDYGATKTENKFIFVELSRELEKIGIASIRFDFYGSGESDGDLLQKTISRDLACASDILAYAHTLSFVDKERIAIVGKGTSCLITSLVATKDENELKALILLSPTLSVWNEQYAEGLREVKLENQISTVPTVYIMYGEKENNNLEILERYQKHYQHQLSLISIASVTQLVETVTSREQVIEQSVVFLNKHLL